MLGEFIKQRRLELGMTQEDLAYKLGYKSKSSINKIEMGINGISYSKIKDFAKALDCPSYLLIEDVAHETRPTDAIMAYAEKLSNLSPENQDNVMKYIDFLSQS